VQLINKNIYDLKEVEFDTVVLPGNVFGLREPTPHWEAIER
jgi:hypothetical protein